MPFLTNPVCSLNCQAGTVRLHRGTVIARETRTRLRRIPDGGFVCLGRAFSIRPPASPVPIVHRSPESFPRADVRVIGDYELRSILESAGYRVEIVRGPDALLVRIDGQTYSLPVP